MNLFASSPFLDVIANTYFKSRQCLVENHCIGGRVFRLLGVAGRGPLTTHQFLDMHEPVDDATSEVAASTIRWLPKVSHGVVALSSFRADPEWLRQSAAPTTMWRDFSTWDRYVELLRRRHLFRDDQRRRRRLEELVGPLTFTADDTRADVLPTTFCWKSAQWRLRAGIDLFAYGRNRDFFHELRSRGLLRASTLRAGRRLLATWLGAVYEKRWYGWIFGFDPDPSLTKYSVGRQLLYPMLEESYRSGHTEFDFSTGCEPYKLFFATHVRTVAPLGTPPIQYQVAWMLRKRLRNAPQAYEKIKALHVAFVRDVFRIKCSFSRP